MNVCVRRKTRTDRQKQNVNKFIDFIERSAGAKAECVDVEISLTREKE